MLTLPIEIANPPKQPVYPTQIIRGLPGIKNWWTTHKEETIPGADGKRRVRPRAGSLQLVENAPVAYATQTNNGKTRTPAELVTVLDSFRFFSADVALSSGWNTIVSVQKRRPGVLGGRIWSLQITEAVRLFLTPARYDTATGAALWVDKGSQFNSAANATNEMFVNVVAFNTVTGQVKRMPNLTQSATESGTLAELTNMVLPATSRLNFGADYEKQVYGGWAFEVGVFGGDLTANTAALAGIRDYLSALYGMVV